jgi:signal transduction histidine kinase
MYLSINKKIKSGYLFAFVLLLVSYLLVFLAVRRLSGKTKIVTHTYTVINKLELLKSAIVDAETGVRGYIITNNIHFLQPYNNGVNSIPGIRNELRRLISDNKSQEDKLDTLNILINKRLEIMSDNMKIFQTSGFIITNEILAKSESGKNTMDSVRLFIGKMQAAEEDLVRQRQSAVTRFFSTTAFITILSLIIAVITIVYCLVTYVYENKAKEKADRNASQYRLELENSISKLKQMNTELQELKSIEKFAATGRIARTMAHEVRNPLTNISLATEQLQEMEIPNADSSILLGMISRNAGRINQLVSDLLNATRFVQLEFKETTVYQLIEETLQMANDRIELNHIKVEKSYSKELCTVSVDTEKMEVALLNIIVNAIEAMEKDKGILQLKSKKQGDKCIIEIKDNGVGMDEDTLQKLFEPYFTGKINGNGLGLTNTQNIILNHKGNIKVYSKPGQGTLFIIILNISVN